jgi:formylglycine-generating enzyme required for sulfatase activity
VFCDTLKDSSEGPEMIVIPEGSFEMGDVECIGDEEELPVHSVVIARPFAIGKYPVTFNEYDKCCRATGRDLVRDRWGRGRLPVIHVSWDDAVAYYEWLSDQTGETYRLPSEAEWEYAARGGPRQETWAGTSEESEVGEYACYAENSEGQAHPVGEKRPNSFGIYDLSGNVWEWVEDCWNENYEGAPSDGSAWLSGKCGGRVLRGGSWSYYRVVARCAARFRYYPDIRTSLIGFRCARTG